MRKREEKDFQKETIRILRPVTDGDRGTELAIVRWIVNGVAYSPQLVNQEVYMDRIDRKRRYGKMKGMNAGDWKFCMDRAPEILELLLDMGAGRKKASVASPQGAAANDIETNEQDEVPF